MEALGFSLRQEAVPKTLTADVLNSSENEEEKPDAEEVRSSIARRVWSPDSTHIAFTDRFGVLFRR